MRKLVLAAALSLSLAPALAAQDSSSRPGNRLPFTREQNADGARFVWFIMGRAGFPYPYIPAKDFPGNGDFTEVPSDSARDGDVAWWPTFVAIYGGADSTVVLPEGPTALAALKRRLGPPRVFRKLVPK